MFKFLQDVIIKLLKGVVEQLRRIKKNDEERHKTQNLSTETKIDTSGKIYNVIETSEVSTPTEETKQIVTKRRNIMTNKTIYNRKVYMLIDQSGSMSRTDALYNDKRRWNAIAESIEGHVYKILSQKDIMKDQKICDEIIVTFFSPNSPSKATRYINDSSQVGDIFEEYGPESTTFLAPTFQKIVEQWFGTRDQNEGGFIIIYTDGEIDDRDAFVNSVGETCRKLNNQEELKVVIIGFGSDVNRKPEFYLKLDANMKSFKDRNSNPCNIVVFDLLNKMDDGIINLLRRQLEDPKAGLPEWGKEFCPDLYD